MKKEKIKVGDYVRIIKPDTIIEGDNYFTAGKDKIAKVVLLRKGDCRYKVQFLERVFAVEIYSDSEVKKLTDVEIFMEIL